MGYLSSLLTFIFIFADVVFYMTKGEPLVPALFIFGDYIVDVGNNNYIHSSDKANFFPYGRDFVTRTPTGRMSNGKLSVDNASEYAGFSSYQPAYLSLNTKGDNLLNGANFASSASGYHVSTATLYHAVPLMQQLELYKDCQNELVKIAGKTNATSIISGAAYILVAGSGFFEARKGCCASGLIEVGFTCNRKSIGICANASEYVFWDSLHPTQATNKFLIDQLIPSIISLVYH